MTVRSIKDSLREFDCEELVHFLPFKYHAGKSDLERFTIWRSVMCNQDSSDILFRKNGSLKTLATKLDWDTAFFKKQIWKFQIACWNDSRHSALQHLQDIEHELKLRGGQYIFVFAPTQCIDMLDVLGRNGWSVIEIRGLLYRTLDDISDLARYPVISAGESDVKPLARVAAEMTNPYDRFHSDTYFKRDSIDAFMKKWVENSILHQYQADKVLRPTSSPDAFLSINHRKNLYQFGIKDTQLVLSAVSPKMKGWFGKLISEAAHISRKKGAEYLSITTQMNNTGAIKTCQRLNMKIADTQLVLRKILKQ